MDLTDILHIEGQDNIGGLGSILLIAKIDDIATFPDLPASPTTDAEYCTITDDFVMQTGKFFHQIYLTGETGSLENKKQGSRDGQSYEHILTFDHPGNAIALEAFVRKTANCQLVVLATGTDGTVYMVGSTLLAATVAQMDTKNGPKTANAAANKFTVTAFGRGKMPIFTGAASLS